MNTRTATKTLSVVFLLMFFWVEMAQAALIRGSGRTTYRDQYSEAVYYVENQYLNEMGVKSDEYFSFNWDDDVTSRTGGTVGISASPGECTRSFTKDEEYEADERIGQIESELTWNDDPNDVARLEAELADLYEFLEVDPCVWQFEEGEDLFLWGFFAFVFDSTDVDYDVTWSISGNGNFWSEKGTVNSDGPITDPDDSSYTIGNKNALLSIPAPSGLTVGDYEVSVSVTISSDDGGFVYESGNHPNGPYWLEEQCVENPGLRPWDDAREAFLTSIDHLDDPEYTQQVDAWFAENPEPEYDICGYAAQRTYYDSATRSYYDEVIPAPTYFSSTSEILRITPMSAAIQDPSQPIDEPNPFGLLVFGMGGLLVRYRLQNGV